MIFEKKTPVFLSILLGVTVLGACGSNAEADAQKKETTEKDGTVVVKDTPDTKENVEPSNTVTDQKEIAAPTFKVELNLSEKALDKFKGTKETIIIDVAFTGELKPNSKLETSEDGQFYIANASREIKPGETAIFSEIMIPEAIMNELKNKDYEVAVNVYSGRKAFKNNVLSTDGAFGKISEFKNKKITVEGKLIEE